MKVLWQASPIALAVLAVNIGSSVQAQTKTKEMITQIEQYGREGQTNTVDQVTNVNQLRDVSPTDWAYEALKSLVDRYGCISGFPRAMNLQPA